MIFNNNKKQHGRKTPGSTQALEADHNDVVASMNSIILSFFGFPKTREDVPVTNGRSCPNLAKSRCEISVDKDEQRGNYILNSNSK